MNLTLDEIATHSCRLRQEIMEREIVLAAFAVVEKYAASGHAPKSMRLDSLVSALLPSKPTLELKEASIRDAVSYMRKAVSQVWNPVSYMRKVGSYVWDPVSYMWKAGAQAWNPVFYMWKAIS